MTDVSPIPKVPGWTRKNDRAAKKRKLDAVLAKNSEVRWHTAGGRCERCGVAGQLAVNLTAHHVDRRGMGGASKWCHRVENLRIVCSVPGGCHDWIHEDESRGRREGWLA